MENENNEDVPFVLKHRILGAAVLLFFGAWLLPWFLGPPSDVTTGNTESYSVQEDAIENQNITSELLAAIENEEVDDEQVYISRITPLTTVETNLEPEVKLIPEALIEKFQADAALNSPVNAENSSVSDNSGSGETAPQDQISQEKETTINNISPDTPANQNEAKAPIKPSLNQDIQPQSQNKLDVGWIVQVGIFTNPNGVKKVINDLQSKGFKPSVTIVDTNQGKNTGTRVWLGPFESRVAAAKRKSLLTQKTGEAGFIRAYP